MERALHDIVIGKLSKRGVDPRNVERFWLSRSRSLQGFRKFGAGLLVIGFRQPLGRSDRSAGRGVGHEFHGFNESGQCAAGR